MTAPRHGYARALAGKGWEIEDHEELGIEKRILFLTLVPLALIVSAITAHFLVTRLEERAQVLNERGSAIARGLAPASEYGVLAGNRAILQGLARSTVQEGDVLSVTISDLDGQVLAQASRPAASDSDAGFWGALFPSRHHVFRAPIFQSQVAFGEVQALGPEPARRRRREGQRGTPRAAGDRTAVRQLGCG